jgi:hypothetical protein
MKIKLSTYLERRLGEPQQQTKHCQDKKHSLSLPGTEPQFCSCPAHSSVTTLAPKQNLCKWEQNYTSQEKRQKYSPF